MTYPLNKYKMEQKIKQLRVKLDGLTQLTQALDPHGVGHATRTREISLAITSLELSKMWLGKVLKELGTANPYPESKNPETEKIEPAADTAYNQTVNSEGSFLSGVIKEEIWNEFTHIQKVKWLRAEIEKVELELKKLHTDISYGTYEWDYIKHSTKYCIEAGMWLGMELGRIRDTKQI